MNDNKSEDQSAVDRILSDQAITPREVLDGEWVTCWEALQIAEDKLRDEAIETDRPVGQILARMAATGYLPTISNDVTHTVSLDDPAVADEPNPLSMSEDDRFAYYRQKEEDKIQGKGKWRLVSPKVWGAVFGFCGVEGLRIHLAMPSFKRSDAVVVFTKENFDRSAPLWEIMNDPGYYMIMARNILVYKDGLYSFSRYAQGWPDEDDLYMFNNLDLSRLRLPEVLPLAMNRPRSLAEEHLCIDQPSVNSRGRPGGRNGEPIAALTIKLMGQDEAALASYTAEAAGTELQSIYAMLGIAKRGIDNCRKDAAGVLRQVRGARGIKQ